MLFRLLNGCNLSFLPNYWGWLCSLNKENSRVEFVQFLIGKVRIHEYHSLIDRQSKSRWKASKIHDREHGKQYITKQCHPTNSNSLFSNTSENPFDLNLCL
jgi:hypothetical protein